MISPAVTLSPKARKRVRDSRGGVTLRVTVNEHETAVVAASVAVHCTCVAPLVKGDPEARVQLVCTGATPPEVVGAMNVTAVGLLVAATVTFAGQLMASADVVVGGVVVGGVGGGVAIGGVEGAVGDEQPPAPSSNAAPHATSARLEGSAHRSRKLRSIRSNR